MCHQYTFKVPRMQFGDESLVVGYKIIHEEETMVSDVMREPFRPIPVGPGWLIGEPRPDRQHIIECQLYNGDNYLTTARASVPGGLYFFTRLPNRHQCESTGTVFLVAAPTSWIRWVSPGQASAFALLIAKSGDALKQAIRQYFESPAQYWGFRWEWAASKLWRSENVGSYMVEIANIIHLPHDLRQLAFAAPSEAKLDSKWDGRICSHHFAYPI